MGLHRVCNNFSRWDNRRKGPEEGIGCHVQGIDQALQTEKRAPIIGALLCETVQLITALSAYHDSLPWQELEQLRDEAFQPLDPPPFLTPFA